MLPLIVIWSLATVGITLVIQRDLRRLAIHRAGLTRTGWLVGCLCIGLPMGLAYLVCRCSARRALVESVWKLAGNAEYPVDVRLNRLNVLRDTGLVGTTIYRACIDALDRDAKNSKSGSL